MSIVEYTLTNYKILNTIYAMLRRNPHSCFLYACYWQNIEANEKYLQSQNCIIKLFYSYGNINKIQWQNLYKMHLKFVESFW